MKRSYCIAGIVLDILLSVGLVSEAWAKAGDMPMATRNSVRLYGGVGYWGLHSEYVEKSAAGDGDYYNYRNKYYVTAIYGFNYQRDLIRRFSVELDVQGSYRNTFPDVATPKFTGEYLKYPELGDRPEVREYIDDWILKGNDPNNLIWLRHNSLAITFRPVFHMIDNEHHRFSAYLGVGWYFVDGLCFKAMAPFPQETYTTATWQYHVSGVVGNLGLRYEYTFLEHFMAGVEVNVNVNDDRAFWQNSITQSGPVDVRGLIFIGFRM